MNGLDELTRKVEDWIEAARDDKANERGEPLPGPVSLPISSAARDARELWLSWRWCLPNEVDPRGSLIFSLGDLIEDELVRIVKAGGVEIITRDGDGQIPVRDVCGHMRGKLDGVLRGLLLPSRSVLASDWILFEAKSMNRKNFLQLVKKGIQEHNPGYYAQVMVYARKANVRFILVMVYCKDDSEIYSELLELDEQKADGIIERMWSVAESKVPPETSLKRTSREIKWRPEQWRRIYFGDEAPVSTNCRNCFFSAPVIDGEDREKGVWRCRRHDAALSTGAQKTGCADHLLIPELVPAELVDLYADHAAAKYRVKSSGLEFWNVPSAHRGDRRYDSGEIAALSREGFAGVSEAVVDEMRKQLDARVVENPSEEGESDE